MKKIKQKERCFLKYCTNYSTGRSHGLCSMHQKDAAHNVKVGLATWDGLRRYGLAKPLKKTT